MQTRLNKYIAASGNTSRRKADELILAGRIIVNSKVVRLMGFQIDEDADKVYLDGELIRPAKKVYYILNKPKGYVTTTEDEKRRPVVTELVPKIPSVFPVGRLDLNTTGVLLLTNDGDFANHLLHPSNGFMRTYIAKLDKSITDEHILRLTKGIRIENRQSKFHSLESLNKAKSLLRATTQEGRNHFVKRLFSALGYTVTALHRESIGVFSLEDIPPGSYKKLNQSTIREFYEHDDKK